MGLWVAIVLAYILSKWSQPAAVKATTWHLWDATDTHWQHLNGKEGKYLMFCVCVCVWGGGGGLG